MPRHDQTLAARDGLSLATYRWAAPGAARAVVVLTHGHGEYATKYEHVAQAFNARGHVFCAYDLRGHGRSGGPRGHSPRYEALLSDLGRVVAAAQAEHPDRPLFLYGHSLGGQITLSYAIQRRPQAAGVIVSAPWLKLIYMPPAWKVMLARTLAGLVPTFSQETGLDTAVPMTHDTALMAAYPDPHLVHARMSARLGADALVRGEALLAEAGALRLPLLLIHGGADGVFAPATSQDFVERVASSDKTFTVYPGLYHEVHNEVERARVLGDILDWIDRRCP